MPKKRKKNKISIDEHTAFAVSHCDLFTPSIITHAEVTSTQLIWFFNNDFYYSISGLITAAQDHFTAAHIKVDLTSKDKQPYLPGLRRITIEFHGHHARMKINVDLLKKFHEFVSAFQNNINFRVRYHPTYTNFFEAAAYYLNRVATFGYGSYDTQTPFLSKKVIETLEVFVDNEHWTLQPNIRFAGSYHYMQNIFQHVHDGKAGRMDDEYFACPALANTIKEADELSIRQRNVDILISGVFFIFCTFPMIKRKWQRLQENAMPLETQNEQQHPEPKAKLQTNIRRFRVSPG